MARGNPIQISFPPTLEAAIRAEAARRQVSFAAVVKEAIEEHLDANAGAAG